MKKYFDYKQFAVWAVVLAALLCILIPINIVKTPTAYATNKNQNEIFYSALGSARKETESFSYATKSVESYLINPTFPNYYNMSSLQNTCANVAGANIVGYYDRYYDNLIPDVKVGVDRNNGYTYYPMKVAAYQLQAVIEDLYARMNTNVNGPGNTQTEYKSGLTSYVQAKGLGAAFYSVMTNGRFDLDKAKAQLKNGNPISLFMSGYNFTNITDNGSTVTLNKNLFDGNHIAIVYGYEKVVYYNSNGGVIKSEIYLKASTGIDGVSGVYVVNKYGTLNDAEAAHIG